MKKKDNEIIDIQIYASDPVSSDVTIGEWKTCRERLKTDITTGKRLCTYADLVCDFIRMSREVMNSMGINVLPNLSPDQINDIVVIRGKECVPYTVASRSE